MRQRLVIDTNVLLSHLLLPGSVPDQVVIRAVRSSQMLVSEATLAELIDVISRPKFDPYIRSELRRGLISRLTAIAEVVPILRPIQACRDPRDNKVLEVAVNGSAHAVITGDADLRALHLFRGIAIMTPAQWLNTSEPGSTS